MDAILAGGVLFAAVLIVLGFMRTAEGKPLLPLAANRLAAAALAMAEAVRLYWREYPEYVEQLDARVPARRGVDRVSEERA